MSIDPLDPIWNALANPHRRQLLDLVRDGPLTTGELAAAFPDLSRYAVMQHIGVLTDAGLLLPRHEGRYRYNYLNPIPIRRIYERWIRPFAGEVAGQMLSLGSYLHSTKPKEDAMQMKSDQVVKIEAEIHLEASPEEVFTALTTELDGWWPFRSREHARVVYEPHVGGRMYEDWGDGAGMLYGQILVYDPPRLSKTLSGSVGNDPYTSMNIDAVEPDGQGSLYKKTLILWGGVPEETPGTLRSGIATFMEKNLKPYVENLSR